MRRTHETFPFTEKEELENKVIVDRIDRWSRSKRVDGDLEDVPWVSIEVSYPGMTRRDDDQLPLKLFAIDRWRDRKRKVSRRRKNPLVVWMEPARKIEFLPLGYFIKGNIGELSRGIWNNVYNAIEGNEILL